MPDLVNRLVVEEYRRKFDAAQGMIFVSMAGLSVAEVENIRGALADQGVELQMLRNSLAAHVLGEQGYSFADSFFVGNLALAQAKLGQQPAGLFLMLIRKPRQVRHVFPPVGLQPANLRIARIF